MDAENKSKILFISALGFIRNNPSIILSIGLVVFMPLALYFNTYLILSTFEKNIGTESVRKAAMVENVIDSLLSQNIFDQSGAVQEKIDEIGKRENEIKSISILVPNPDDSSQFKIIASSNKEGVGQISKSIWDSQAWSDSHGIGYLEKQGGERIWITSKALHNNEDKKIGLISLSLSLKNSDQLMSQSLSRSYAILLITILVTLVFILNHARLFKYAVSLTKLKEVDEMKDNFISMASHELRSPLTALRGYVSFIEEESDRFSEKTRHNVDVMKVCIDRLNNLVDDILEVSRLEQNRIPFEMETLDPDKIIFSSIEELKSKADEKNLEIIYSSGALPKIKADPDRLKQILVNLVSNAIKYTREGKIEIIAKKSYKYLDMTVTDTGLGISAEEQKNLFSKFYRVKSKETEGIIGTGLGLWIVKEMAEKMKGKLSVESIPGVGSHFTVSFPISAE